MDALGHLESRVKWCEENDVAILCCPEAILGGLADYAPEPSKLAIASDNIEAALAPIASAKLTIIVGFTERCGGRLYNSAAVLQNGSLIGTYRKHHPAIHHSVYSPGSHIGIFTARGSKFGILICNDSNDPRLASRLAALGAAMLFVPTNNGMPLAKPHSKIGKSALAVDTATAATNRLWVIRADVAGQAAGLASFGSSAIVAPDGFAVVLGREWSEDLIVAEIPESPRWVVRGVG
jgi:predicted amidohydrolase